MNSMVYSFKMKKISTSIMTCIRYTRKQSGNLLEVCVDSVESALNAWMGGAKRLELCSSLSLGGLTPSLGLFTVIKKLVTPDCAVFVMIRPIEGESYVYNNYEIDVMAEDIRIFKQNGADGFVFGCLNKSKQIDEEGCMKLLKEAQGLPSTFHRAFDIVENPENSLMTLIQLGFSRVLTSGQEKNAFLGRNLIKKLVKKVEESGSDLIIIAGGGISTDNLKEILEITKVKEYHSSARKKFFSDTELHVNNVTNLSIVKELVKVGEVL